MTSRAEWARRASYSTRRRAKGAWVPHSITPDDLVALAGHRCPVLGVVLNYQGGNGPGRPDTPTVDRIDPTLGYVPGNVVVLSARANVMKNDASLQELESLVRWLRRIQPEQP